MALRVIFDLVFRALITITTRVEFIFSGHGIPEALEAILFGRSRMEAKVAVLKPL